MDPVLQRAPGRCWRVMPGGWARGMGGAECTAALGALGDVQPGPGARPIRGDPCALCNLAVHHLPGNLPRSRSPRPSLAATDVLAPMTTTVLWSWGPRSGTSGPRWINTERDGRPTGGRIPTRSSRLGTWSTSRTPKSDAGAERRQQADPAERDGVGDRRARVPGAGRGRRGVRGRPRPVPGLPPGRALARAPAPPRPRRPGSPPRRSSRATSSRRAGAVPGADREPMAGGEPVAAPSLPQQRRQMQVRRCCGSGQPHQHAPRAAGAAPAGGCSCRGVTWPPLPGSGSNLLIR